jgi:hypothetical protein
MRAAAARVVREFHRAVFRMQAVFGFESVVTATLCARVDAIGAADVSDVARHASALLALLPPLAATCELLEIESEDASAFRVDLAAIADTCRRLITPAAEAPAVEPLV